MTERQGIYLIKTLNFLVNIQISSLANRILYYLQRMPVLGVKIKDTVYAKIGLKRIAALIASLLFIVWGFLRHMLYIGLVVYIPILLFAAELPQNQQLELFWNIFFILSFIVAPVSSARILEPKRNKYVAVKLMRLPATRYMRVTLGSRYIGFLIYMIPAMFMTSSNLGASLYQGILAVIAVVLWRMFAEYIHLLIFQKTGKIIIKQVSFVWVIIIIGYVAAFAPMFVHWVPTIGQMVLFSMPFMLLCLIVGTLSSLWLMLKVSYKEAVDASTQRDDPYLDFNKMMKEANTSAVAAKESDYDYESILLNPEKHLHLQGYAYMNALFFSRHQSLVRTPFIKRLLIATGLGLAAILLAYFNVDPTMDTDSMLRSLLPILIFVMSFITMGENLCKGLFYNCDLTLLRYSFYRRDTFQHYRIRLRKLITMNTLIGAVFAFMLTIALLIIEPANITNMIIIWISVIALSVFFSVHYLYTYYILQPFTTELDVKNPFYFLFTYVISAIYIVMFILRLEPIVFAITVSTASLIYLVISYPLVRKYGPKMFRIK